MTDTMNGDTSWTIAEMCEQFGLSEPQARQAAPASQPIARKAARSATEPHGAFAAAVKQALANERARRASDVAALRSEIAELRAEIAVARRVADMGERLDRLEARGAPLRTVG